MTTFADINWKELDELVRSENNSKWALGDWLRSTYMTLNKTQPVAKLAFITEVAKHCDLAEGTLISRMETSDAWWPKKKRYAPKSWTSHRVLNANPDRFVLIRQDDYYEDGEDEVTGSTVAPIKQFIEEAIQFARWAEILDVPGREITEDELANLKPLRAQIKAVHTALDHVIKNAEVPTEKLELVAA